MKQFLTLLLIFCTAKSFSHPGVGIIMDSRKNVYYTDLKQVWKIDVAGKKSVVLKNVHTHELYIDVNDNLFGEHLWYKGEATDKWAHYVWRLSADGLVSKVIPDREGFLTNYSFVRDRHENMYWADRSKNCQRLARKTRDGKITIKADQCFEDVRWMTCAGDGTVFLIDKFNLKKVDSSGHATVLAKRIQENDANILTLIQPDDPHHIMGIWLDLQKNVYAAIAGGRVVKKISPTGSVTVVAHTDAPWSPNGGFITDDGDFWLLESAVIGTYKVRVERIKRNGERRVF